MVAPPSLRIKLHWLTLTHTHTHTQISTQALRHTGTHTYTHPHIHARTWPAAMSAACPAIGLQIVGDEPVPPFREALVGAPHRLLHMARTFSKLVVKQGQVSCKANQSNSCPQGPFRAGGGGGPVQSPFCQTFFNLQSPLSTLIFSLNHPRALGCVDDEAQGL